MHLTSEPESLRQRTNAPQALCDLVHRMLDKEPSMRPGAIEVRQLSRAIALDLSSSAYEEFQISGVEQPRTPKAARSRPRAQIVPTDEVVVVDPESLEFGVTELLPVVRKPRWTPDISTAMPASQRERTRAASEIVLLDKRRS